MTIPRWNPNDRATREWIERYLDENPEADYDDALAAAEDLYDAAVEDEAERRAEESREDYDGPYAWRNG